MDFRSFFNNPFDNNDDDEKKNEEKYFEDEEDSDDEDYLGCTNIFKIKGMSMINYDKNLELDSFHSFLTKFSRSM